MSIKENILQKIKKDHIEPITSSTVLRKKYLMILLFLLLIGLGIFIVSFFLSDISWLGELLEMDTLYMILVWTIVIIFLWIFIYKDSRTIGTLYRYSMKKVLGAILGIMILGWSLLYFSGIDHSIQMFLIRYTGYERIMSTYTSWNKPEQWKLIGEITEIRKDGLIITDLDGKDWNILLSEDTLKQKNTHNENTMEEWNVIKITGKLQGHDIFIGDSITLLFK